jgi:hypothetical protein
MIPLVAIIPSRGRPQAIREVITAFRETCTANTKLVVAVDDDDPLRREYQDVVVLGGPGDVDLFVAPAPSTMVATLNAAARHYAPRAQCLAFLGDDHRPRTRGWDGTYLRELGELGTGIVYGDDLLQGQAIPTQVAMTADIVQALGHMAPPCLTHLFVDNYWRDLGKGADCIRYLPDVVVEHVHPFANKAVMDDGYARVNAPLMYATDSAAYGSYAARHLVADIQKVKALR